MSTDTPQNTHDTQGGGDDVSTAAVADPEEYSQQRRLKAIHDARERVIDTRDRVEEARILQNFDNDDARKLVRRAVENYILEVEPLLTDPEIETVVDYWNGEDVQLGQMALHPPSDFNALLKDDRVFLPKGSSRPEPVGVTFYGVKSILEAGRPVTATFEMTYQQKHHGIQTVSRTVGKEIPLQILENAYRTVNRFLREVDIDASLDDDAEDAGFEYDDIVENGPPAGDPASERDTTTAEGDD